MFHEEFKRYWKKVEQNLTCSRVSRKKFYRQTLEAADRFLAEQPEVNFAHVEEFLGSPQELAQSYLDTLPLKEISTFRRRWQWRLIAAIAVILLLLCVVIGVCFMKRDVVVISVETGIIDEGNISVPESLYAEE